ncbi:MAG: redoxin domain-containing protein [Gemmatimonadetes bacterium]|nr:redoxin domain-containing protein [Gemmatimonadota bacterium]
MKALVLGTALLVSTSSVGVVYAQDTPRLGPKDGPTSPATDLDRVKVGDAAPDFTLAALDGRRLTLSDYRGKKNVILVFYRGWW